MENFFNEHQFCFKTHVFIIPLEIWDLKISYGEKKPANNIKMSNIFVKKTDTFTSHLKLNRLTVHTIKKQKMNESHKDP